MNLFEIITYRLTELKGHLREDTDTIAHFPRRNYTTDDIFVLSEVCFDLRQTTLPEIRSALRAWLCAGNLFTGLVENKIPHAIREVEQVRDFTRGGTRHLLPLLNDIAGDYDQCVTRICGPSPVIPSVLEPSDLCCPLLFKYLVMDEFAPIVICLVFSLLLSSILITASFIFTGKNIADPEKLSAYECGFDPFSDARSRFDIRFYLVSLLFIIFDLEVTFLFPWAVSLDKIGWCGFWSMMVFVWVLTIGFVIEWKKGALDWE